MLFLRDQQYNADTTFLRLPGRSETGEAFFGLLSFSCTQPWFGLWKGF